MELYKRPGSPNWYITLQDAAGSRKRVSTGERDKRSAQKVAAKLVAAGDAESELVRDGKRPIRLDAALDQYVASLTLAGKSWATGAKLYADKVLGRLASSAGRWSAPSGVWLHEVDPAMLETLKQARLREGNGAASIAHELKVLRAASRYAQGLRFRAPDMLTWRLPKLTSKTRFLSWPEFEALLDHLDPDKPIVQKGRAGEPVSYRLEQGSARWRARADTRDLAVCLALCGGRWAEVASLTWDRVDFDAGTIRLWGNKTQTERLAPLPKRLRDCLQRRKALSGGDGRALVFPGRDGVSERSGTCRALLRGIDRAGLNDAQSIAQSGRATIHSLRHTFASWLIQNGADLAEVQDALGHTTLQMTRRYAHLAKGKTVARLGAILDTVE